MSGSSLEALPDIWQWSGGPPKCSKAPTGSPVVVGWPSQMSGSGREALTDVQEWSGDPPGCP